MPNAATLESLTIEINGNASGASSGITSLIAPLRSLARGAGAAVPALKELNLQLKKLAGYGNIKIPNLTQGGSTGTRNIRERTKALHEAVTELTKFKNMTPAQMQAWRNSDAPILKEFKGMTPPMWNPWRYAPWQKPGITDFRDSTVVGNRISASHPESYLPRDEWERGADANRASIIAREAQSAVKEIVHDVAEQVTNSNTKPIAIPAQLQNPGGHAGFIPVDPTLEARSKAMLEKQAQREAEREAMRRNAENIQFTPPGFKATAESANGATAGIRNVTDSLKNSEKASKRATTALKDVDKELKQKKKDGKAAKEGLSDASRGVRQIGVAVQKTQPSLNSFSKSLSMISRIAKTMLIRTALRALMRAFSESWLAAYEFSNNMGGSFSRSVDRARSALSYIGTSIVQAVAPAFEALIPVIELLTYVVAFLCDGIILLLRLFGMTSDISTASIGDINKYYGDSAKGATTAAKANKNLLASWDELNIIQSNSANNNPNGYKTGGYKPISLLGEYEMPSWLMEWKPLIDAIILGTLGGIILPKIFDWVSKIFGLGSGGGATNIMDILKKLLKFPDFKFPEIPSDWMNFKFPEIPDNLVNFKFPDIPDLTGLTDLVNQFTGFDWKGLAVVLLPSIIGLLSTILSSLLQALGTTAKIKVDRKEYDDFKKDFEDWKKKLSDIKIKVAFDDLENNFETPKKDIDEWVGKTVKKNVKVSIPWLDWLTYSAKTALVDEWVDKDAKKSVKVSIPWLDWVAYSAKTVLVDNWVAEEALKLVKTGFEDSSYTNFWKIADTIDKWVSRKDFKIVEVVVNDPFHLFVPYGSAPKTSTKNNTKNTQTTTTNNNNNSNWFTTPIVNTPFSDTMQNWAEDIWGWMTRNSHADGAYGIPMGDLFIANEAGAELVGSMNGKTTVANQGQIIEGIQSGVYAAQSEQNSLLRRQNELLTRLVEKNGEIKITPSAEWGKFNQRSNEMWGRVSGR